MPRGPGMTRMPLAVQPGSDSVSFKSSAKPVTTACAAGATARAPLQWADCEHDAASSCTGAGLGAAGLVAWLVPANQAPDHVSYYLIAPGGSAGPSW